jgi:gliding motility-associated-like protein
MNWPAKFHTPPKLIILTIIVFVFFTNATAQKWLWAKQGKSTHAQNSYSIVAVDKHGNAYLASEFGDTLLLGGVTLIDTTAKYENFFLAKYNSSGVIQWAKKMGTYKNTGSGAGGICVDTAGNVYVTGGFNDTIDIGAYQLRTLAEGECTFIAKFDSNGNAIWAHQSVIQHTTSGSGGNSIAVSESGASYITGNFSDTVSFAAHVLIESGGPYNGNDVFLVKYDAGGNVLWAKQSLSTISNHTGTGNGVAVDAAEKSVYISGEYGDTIIFGPYMLNGHNYQNGYSTNVYLTKYDTNGNVQWARQSQNKSINHLFASSKGTSVTTDNAGNPYITGFFEDTISFGPNSFYTSDYGNLFIAKYNANGDLDWVKDQSVPGLIAFGNRVIADSYNNIYLQGSGQHADSIKIGGFVLDKLHAANGTAIYIIKLDTAGNAICGSAFNWMTFNAPILEYATSDIACDPTGNYIDATSFLVGDTVALGPDTVICNNYTDNLPLIARWQACCTTNDSINIAMCNSNFLTLTASGSASYDWSNGSNSSTIKVNPTNTTNYQVVINRGSCIVDSNIHVKVNPLPTVNISSTLNPICNGDSSEIIAPGANSYLWNTGATTSNIMVNPTNTTTYSLEIGNGICNADTDITIIVNPIPVASISGKTSLCYGNNTTLIASGGTSYIWSNGATTTSITVSPNSDSTYRVSVISKGCKDSTSANITVNSLPLIYACCDTNILFGQNVQLTSSGGTNYNWLPVSGLSCDNCSNPSASPAVTTTYTLTVSSDSGCSASTTITIEVSCGTVFVPDAFSPNGDGQNDYLYVRGDCIKDVDFIVFDRWGNKVFETTDKSIPWNGMYKGEVMNTGSYVYSLSATMYDGSSLTKKGNVTLVR